MGSSQFMSYNGFNSDSYNSISGIPQGSNLGPLLSITDIDDLNTIVTSNKLRFADDFKISNSISVITCCQNLQSQIVNIQRWCTENK